MPRLTLAAGLLLLATTSAYGICRDTPENRQACMGDAVKLCLSEAVSGGTSAAVTCLQHNRDKLSIACSQALSTCEATPQKRSRFFRVPKGRRI